MKGYFMKNKKLGMAVLTTPLIFTSYVSANDLIHHNVIKKDISKQAIGKIDNKVNNRINKASKAWVEAGPPWVEWSQEQKDGHKNQLDNPYQDKINVTDSFEKNAPKGGKIIKKETINIRR